MTKETQTVWRDSKGGDLLVSKGQGQFYVPLSIVSAETLRELAAACQDAAKGSQEAPTPADSPKP